MKYSNFKRILSMVLVVFMVMAMIVPSYAATSTILPGVLPGGLLAEYYEEAANTPPSALPGLRDVMQSISNSFYSQFDPFGTYAARNPSDSTTGTETSGTTYVLAGSDYQAEGGDAAGSETINAIVSQIKKAYPSIAMDGFLFCGDYSHGATQTTNVQSLKNTIINAGIDLTEDEMVLIQGNHDNSSEYSGTVSGLVGTLLNNSGNNDPQNGAGPYSVFVINEKDYMWRNGSKTTIQATAQSLKTYLDAKIEAKYTKPIFVVSHLPLNYNMRTKNDGDGRYAKYIFDVLNAAGKAGLNIIFLFGHDHSNGWDDYLGGSAIYLAKGDKIMIAQDGSQEPSKAKEETLAFTYMNAGYVGYYTKYTDNAGAETDLTMTLFEITDTQVKVSRFSAAGLHDMKSKGVTNTYKGEQNYKAYYGPNETVYTSPQIIELNFMLNKKLVTVTDNDVSVTGYDLTSLSAIQTATKRDGYSAYVAYDINPAGYISGTEATVVMPVDGFDTNRKVEIIDLQSGTTIAVAGIVNGKVTFTATHFSEYAGAQVDLTGMPTDWTEIPGETTESVLYYELVSTIESGKEYLIASGSTRAVRLLDGDGNAISATVTDRKIPVGVDSKAVWIISSEDNGYTIRNYNNQKYVNLSVDFANYNLNYKLELKNTSQTVSIAKNNNNNGAFTISAGSGRYKPYLTFNFNNNKFGAANSGSSVYFFKKVTNTVTTPSTYVGMLADEEYSVVVNTKTENDLRTEIMKDSIKVYVSTKEDHSDAAPTTDFTLEGKLDPTTVGSYPLTVKYNGITLGTVTVKVEELKVINTALSPMYGTVKLNAGLYAAPGSKIVITYEGGAKSEIPVTLNMITGAYTTATAGVYSGLTVTYGDYKWTDYTLEVVAPSQYPDYPNEGAVKVNKTSTGVKFQQTGVSKIELSASGVPSKKGADVIVMLDLSSSMGFEVEGIARIDALKGALRSMLSQFKDNGEDGLPMDIRVAVADFHKYYNAYPNSPYYPAENDKVKNGSVSTSNSYTNKVYTGPDKTIGAGAFVDVATLSVNEFDNISIAGGTNYDYAFDVIYQLGHAITKDNKEKGVERDLFVIFMSDGTPFQFNYFRAKSDDVYWNNWLSGTMTDAMYGTNAKRDYYNPEGKHWMAEAIKGSPAQKYKVIRKNNTGLEDLIQTNNTNIYQLPGLGAKMYSVGFCIAKDKQIAKETTDALIKRIATDSSYYFPANTPTALEDAFTQITRDIAYAATNAKFVDVMGPAFNLQITPTVSRENGKVTINLADYGVTPSIEVISYDIYTRDDYLNGGGAVTLNMVGTRKGTSTLLERVTFSTDGKQAFSNKVGGGLQNILINGVICANTFWYNTKEQVFDANGKLTEANAVKVDTNGDGTAEEFLDTDGDGVVDDMLAAESFYWKVGTVESSELAIAYYVYLDESQEGGRPAGSYVTNASAVLYYDNYLGQPSYRETVSPNMAWKAANLSYGFYLVNEQGQPVKGGSVVSFADREIIIDKTFYSEILLNNVTSMNAFEALKFGAHEKIPEGYQLYDFKDGVGPTYTVGIFSADVPGSRDSWTITSPTGATNANNTTYITGSNYKGQAFTNVMYADHDMDTIDHVIDFTHTTVWFALVWTPRAMDDTVVIDYGLPVNVHVLENDLFGDYGTLEGVADTVVIGDPYGEDTNRIPSQRANGKAGTAEINKAAGIITYKPTKMTMASPDVFYYSVHYNNPNADGSVYINDGYYYGKLTVIPATSIYYEENFVTFKDATVESEGTGKWSAVTSTSGSQAEDRPGQSDIKFDIDIDADNLYGYDGIYNSSTIYSLGSVKKVTVNAESGAVANAPYAEFTFKGTGFDIVSLTDNDSGIIRVTVTNEQGSQVRGQIIDNYYGYTYDTVKNEFVVNPDANGSIYQVPVIKMALGTYGTYTVKIEVIYLPSFDHKGDGSYSFWLDSIRIYDPAGINVNDDVIGDAYLQDNEAYPQYLMVKEAILKASEVNGAAGTELFMGGAVFIDGKASTNLVADYANPGPNNEAYLANGQGISFKLTSSIKPATVQLGAKLAFGTSATLKINADEDLPLATLTDMYYDISSSIVWTLENGVYVSNPITLSNASSGAVISLTNIKMTYKENPTPAQGARSIGFMVDNETVNSGLSVMRALYAAPAVPAAANFEPDVLAYTLGNQKLRAIGSNTITLITSNDVKMLTVNGRAASRIDYNSITNFNDYFAVVKIVAQNLHTQQFTIDRDVMNGKYTVWTYTSAPGETGYEVIAYNAAGVASAPAAASNEVSSNSMIGRTDFSSSLNKSDIIGNKVEFANPMLSLAARSFTPKRFESSISIKADGKKTLAVKTSDDVKYVMANGEIISRYITETVVDLSNNGKETVSRVWIADAKADTIQIATYNESGVQSDVQTQNTQNGN